MESLESSPSLCPHESSDLSLSLCDHPEVIHRTRRSFGKNTCLHHVSDHRVKTARENAKSRSSTDDYPRVFGGARGEFPQSTTSSSPPPPPPQPPPFPKGNPTQPLKQDKNRQSQREKAEYRREGVRRRSRYERNGGARSTKKKKTPDLLIILSFDFTTASMKKAREQLHEDGSSFPVKIVVTMPSWSEREPTSPPPF